MSAQLDMPADEFTEAEMREIEAMAAQELAESCERWTEQHTAFVEWLSETFGGQREAIRIVSIYTLAKLWAQMHRSAETPFWTQQLVRTMQEWREIA